MKQLVKIKILAIFVASLFILSACDREKMDFGNESDGYGQIQLSSMQLSVDVNATPLSRAVTVDAGSYIVGIYNEDGTTLISEWKYSDMPEIFQLKVGKYKIIAHSPDGGEPVFDVPYCQGSQSIDLSDAIRQYRIQAIHLLPLQSCHLAQMLSFQSLKSPIR